MTGTEQDAANWLLAVLTALVWAAVYGLYGLRDEGVQRWLRMTAWRMRLRLRRIRHGRAALPAISAEPVPLFRARPGAPSAPRRPMTGGNAARAVELSEQVRISEWRAENLPLRYRLLGRVRRAANDN